MVRMPSRVAVRAIRPAISPRLAISTEANMAAYYSTAAKTCQANANVDWITFPAALAAAGWVALVAEPSRLAQPRERTGAAARRLWPEARRFAAPRNSEPGPDWLHPLATAARRS